MFFLPFGSCNSNEFTATKGPSKKVLAQMHTNVSVIQKMKLLHFGAI